MIKYQDLLIKHTFLILFLLTLIGGFLRLYLNTKNPISLSIDEVSFGYNAYSVLKTGRDEWGKFLPLSFKSTGDYKNPVPIYLMVPSIAIFGLNEFSIRLPTAVLGILSIVIFYLFFVEFTQDKKISLVATVFLTFSPWHIYYSRYVSDHLIATFFVVLGAWFFLRMIRLGGYLNSLSSGAFFIISMYTYYAERLFVPLLILSLIIINIRLLKNRIRELMLFFAVCALIVSPLASSTFFGPDRARAQMTFITNDIEFSRNVLAEGKQKKIDVPVLGGVLNFFDSSNFLLFSFWTRKYLNYFHPGFFFYSGLNTTAFNTYGLGVIYLFQLPFLVLGIKDLFKKNIPHKRIILSWVLIGLIPASLTNNEQHPGRTFFILPMILLISSYGLMEFLHLINSKFNLFMKRLIYFMFSLLVVWNLLDSIIIYSIHFPKQRGEDFMEGTKETVEYALANKDKYQQIVFDPHRGIEAPYIVSIPHMYLLFYSSYDPLKYQTEQKLSGDEIFGFDKFVFRKIDWNKDWSRKGVLFIGSPWSIPEKDLRPEEMLKKVNLSGGPTAFIIASPR